MFSLAGLAVRFGFWGRGQQAGHQAVAALAACQADAGHAGETKIAAAEAVEFASEATVAERREVRVKQLRAHLSSIVVPDHMISADQAIGKLLQVEAQAAVSQDKTGKSGEIIPFPISARTTPGEPVAATVATAVGIAATQPVQPRRRKNYAQAIQAGYARRPKPQAAKAGRSKKAPAKAKATAKRAKQSRNMVVWLAAR